MEHNTPASAHDPIGPESPSALPAPESRSAGAPLGEPTGSPSPSAGEPDGSEPEADPKRFLVVALAYAEAVRDFGIAEKSFHDVLAWADAEHDHPGAEFVSGDEWNALHGSVSQAEHAYEAAAHRLSHAALAISALHARETGLFTTPYADGEPLPTEADAQARYAEAVEAHGQSRSWLQNVTESAERQHVRVREIHGPESYTEWQAAVDLSRADAQHVADTDRATVVHASTVRETVRRHAKWAAREGEQAWEERTHRTNI